MDTERTNLCIKRVVGILPGRARWIVLCVILVAAAVCECSSYVAG
jgi:hypothetical protein